MEFTFILITKGRTDIEKNIQSCLELNKKIKVKIIIVDGNLNDNINQLIQNKFSFYDIKIIKQKKGKFVRACIEGLAYLDTDYFTFTHDDDFISPYFSELIIQAYNHNTSVIGNGIVRNIFANNYQYKIPENFQFLKKKEILKNYFCSRKINNKYLPVNPSCSVFKKEVSSVWINYLFSILHNKFYSYYLLKKNIGQDLLIYLIAIHSQKKILYCNEDTAQFTSHKQSMSVDFGSLNLGVGYWLAKKIFYKNEKHIFNFIEKYSISLNMFLRGLKLCISNMNNKKSFTKYSTKKFLKEIFNILV
jgi:hypothetical protein